MCFFRKKKKIEKQETIEPKKEEAVKSDDTFSADLDMQEKNAKVTKKETVAAKDYHISKREDGKWQVKREKADKALKLFDTQAEAIAYAKTVAGNQDGNVTVHGRNGKIRKN